MFHLPLYVQTYLFIGYITLFVTAVPFAPLVAFVSNFLEIRIDGYKLLNEYRRPSPSGREDIGSWYAPSPTTQYEYTPYIIHESHTLPTISTTSRFTLHFNTQLFLTYLPFHSFLKLIYSNRTSTFYFSIGTMCLKPSRFFRCSPMLPLYSIPVCYLSLTPHHPTLHYTTLNLTKPYPYLAKPDPYLLMILPSSLSSP